MYGEHGAENEGFNSDDEVGTMLALTLTTGEAEIRHGSGANVYEEESGRA